MFPTTEVRWFLPGVVPARVWQWFDGPTQRPTAQPSRTDYYLRIADGDGLGIKLREGRIEVKQRQSQQGSVRFGERAVGRVEQWRKWSFPLTETEHITAVLGDGLSSWVGVYKERKVRTFQVTDDEVVDVSGTMFLAQGCAWEVAQVRLGKTAESWWSVGFEAFGPEAERMGLLRIVIMYCLDVEDAPLLALENSCSYPKWLQNNEEALIKL